MLVVVFLTFDFYYSCDVGAVWSAGRCFAAGRARSESAFPVLCSGFLWADCCADSNYCEVSPFFFVLLLFLRFRFLCLLLAVSSCWLLDDSLVLGLCLDKCYVHLWWFSIPKVFCCCLFLLNDVRFCAFVVFFVYVVRDFSNVCALVSSEFYWGWWLGYGWMVFFRYLWPFSHFVWVVYLSELVKYFAYWALSSGEIWNYLLEFWLDRSSLLSVIEAVLSFCWFFLIYIGVDGLGMDGWYCLGICDHFRILFGLFTCLSWWNILFIERYLAAKIGTIFLILVWRVFEWLKWFYFSAGFFFKWVLFSSYIDDIAV